MAWREYVFVYERYIELRKSEEKHTEKFIISTGTLRKSQMGIEFDIYEWGQIKFFIHEILPKIVVQSYHRQKSDQRTPDQCHTICHILLFTCFLLDSILDTWQVGLLWRWLGWWMNDYYSDDFINSSDFLFSICREKKRMRISLDASRTVLDILSTHVYGFQCLRMTEYCGIPIYLVPRNIKLFIWFFVCLTQLSQTKQITGCLSFRLSFSASLTQN